MSIIETRSERAYSRVALVSLTLAVVGVGLAIFYVGSAVLVVALVLAIVGLVRSEQKVVPTVALAVCLIPIAAIIVIALAYRR